MNGRASAQLRRAVIPGPLRRGLEAERTVSEISIVPINTIDAGLLTRLALCLEERFLYTGVVRAPLRIPKSALNSVRRRSSTG